MALIVNLRRLAKETIVLEGEMPAAEFDFDLRDPMMQVTAPVVYDLEAEWLDDAILVQGSVAVTLECECVRCLKKFSERVELAQIALHLPLEGEDAVAADHENVDLTPFLREDMLLEFPQHPVCKPECGGLKKTAKTPAKKAGEQAESNASAWAELNKLKLSN